MPPVMRISEHNWERLKMWATPLEDSADDALGKVLDAAEDVEGCHTSRKAYARFGYQYRYFPSEL